MVSAGKTRVFIDLRDAVRYIELAVVNPPLPGSRVRVFDQMTETHRVVDLAKIVARISGADIDYMENPRNKAPENGLSVHNSQLLSLGLVPTTLEEGLLCEITEIAERYRHRCDMSKIPARSRWTRAKDAMAKSSASDTLGTNRIGESHLGCN